MAQKISMVVPIGEKFSFFVHACLKNVFETCGEPDLLDFVFLIPNDPSPEIKNALDEAAKEYRFRIVTAPLRTSQARTPFNTPGADHLQLLDWVVRNVTLSNWVIMQHSDVFWREHNWLPKILAALDPKLVVICPPMYSSISINMWWEWHGINVPIVGDFLGVYNRKQLIERKLYFKWGILGTEVPVSKGVEDAIFDKTLHSHQGITIEMGKYWLDGSQAMAWELAVNYPQGIKILPLDHVHLSAFFRIAGSIYRDEYYLSSGSFQTAFSSFAYFSYLSSFCIERSEIAHIAIPWVWINILAQKHGVDISYEIAVGKWLQSYSKAKDIIALETLGIKKMDICGGVYYHDQTLHRLM